MLVLDKERLGVGFREASPKLRCTCSTTLCFEWQASFCGGNSAKATAGISFPKSQDDLHYFLLNEVFGACSINTAEPFGRRKMPLAAFGMIWRLLAAAVLPCPKFLAACLGTRH